MSSDASRRPRRGPRGINRAALIVSAVLILVIALVALRLREGAGLPKTGLRPGDNAHAAMAVHLTLSSDDADPVEVWRDEVPFSLPSRSLPLRTVEIDLSPWAGKLVRFDLQGDVRCRDSSSPAVGYVGCSAQLVDEDGARLVDFVGWDNDGPREEHVHVGSIGPRAAVLPQGASPSFAYALEGSLWHVVKVPERCMLRLSVTPVLAPVLADDVGSDPTPADVRSPRTSRRRARRSPAASERPPDVFIYLIDALRADHVGCYGYWRNTSPVIDRFAAEAVLFQQAYTPVTWTRPSVATLLSGLYPSVHGVSRWSDRVADWTVLLSEALQQSGYGSYCVATNFHVSEDCGFNQGYNGFAFKVQWEDSLDWITSRVEEFLVAANPEQLVFMYVHTLEPHAPYVPTPESRRLFDRGFLGFCDGSATSLDAVDPYYPWLSETDLSHLLDLYDAEIYDSDKAFGDFLDLLEQTGRFENALIVLLADHGEAFNEHDTLQHGHTLNREEMHIPLIIRFPHGQFAGARVKRPVSLIDIFPTVLSLTGSQPRLEYALPGVDLSTHLHRPAPAARRTIWAEIGHPDLDLLAVIDEDGYKRVIDLSPKPKATDSAVGLWDTNADPGEQLDLRASLPARAAYHEQLLARWLLEQRNWHDRAAAAPAPSVKMSDEVKRGLRALGYLD